MKFAVIYSNHTKTLSYNDDWLEAFLDSNLDIDKYNTQTMSFLDNIKLLFNYDYIVLLHSTNSNTWYLSKLLRFGLLKFRKSKIILFVGNEYKNMPGKISFIINNKVDFIASQLPQDTAQWLYGKTKAKIISLPHALNPSIYKPQKKLDSRDIDIGNRSYEYPWYLGDLDRIKTLNFLEKLDNDFIVDISTDPKKRFAREKWANFLNSCKFTIASEAGSSFLERDDKTRLAVNKFININENTTFDDIYNKFFKNYQGKSINGKCISSRHFDAIGTKTCQILLEGRYNDILIANEHYIELKKDFSNIDEVIEKIKDDKLREKIVDRAYDYAINNHTHKHRIEYLLLQIRGS